MAANLFCPSCNDDVDDPKNTCCGECGDAFCATCLVGGVCPYCDEDEDGEDEDLEDEGDDE